MLNLFKVITPYFQARLVQPEIIDVLIEFSKRSKIELDYQAVIHYENTEEEIAEFNKLKVILEKDEGTDCYCLMNNSNLIKVIYKDEIEYYLR